MSTAPTAPPPAEISHGGFMFKSEHGTLVQATLSECPEVCRLMTAKYFPDYLDAGTIVPVKIVEHTTA